MSSLIPISNKSQSSLSTEPIYVQVSAQVPGSSTPEDIHADTVKFAFKPAGAAPDAPPSGADWTSGTIIEQTTPTGQTIYLATLTVGPSGAVNPGVGVWVVWLYLNDALGTPVAQVGTLTITEL